MMEGKFERVAGPYSSEANGLVWDGEAIVFSLPGENKIARYHPGTNQVKELRKYTFGTRGLAFDATGTLFGCQSAARRVVRFNGDGSASMLADRLDGGLHNRPYDLAIDANGRIWFTDTEPEAQSGVTAAGVGHTSVLKLQRDADGHWALQRMTTDTQSPMGIALASDGQALYVSDNPSGDNAAPRLRSYPIRKADGTLDGHVLLHTFPAGTNAKGICVGPKGSIAVCVGGTGSGDRAAIMTISAASMLLEKLDFEGGEPTNCTMGDPDLTALYVTSSDGCLYRMRNVHV